jgi:hypothetical protein
MTHLRRPPTRLLSARAAVAGFAVRVPATVTANTIFTAAVEALDASGRVVTGYTGTAEVQIGGELLPIHPAVAAFAADGPARVDLMFFARLAPGLHAIEVRTADGAVHVCGVLTITAAPLTLPTIDPPPARPKAKPARRRRRARASLLGRLRARLGYLFVRLRSLGARASCP